jgi:hypothetical protein
MSCKPWTDGDVESKRGAVISFNWKGDRITKNETRTAGMTLLDKPAISHTHLLVVDTLPYL